MNKPLLLSLAALALGATPAAAADFCVADPACEAAGGTPYATVQEAIEAAEDDGFFDRVLIGPGTYTAPTVDGFKHSESAEGIELRGAGQGKTTLTGPTGAITILTADGADHKDVVRDLTIRLPEKSAPKAKGLLLRGKAHDIEITMEPVQSWGVVGISVGGPLHNEIHDVTVDFPWNWQANRAVDVHGQVAIRDCELTAFSNVMFGGMAESPLIERSTLRAVGGTAVQGGPKGTAIVRDSLILGQTKMASAIQPGTFNTDVDMIVDGVTMIGSGVDPQAVAMYAGSLGTGNVKLTLRDSIVRGWPNTLGMKEKSTGKATVDASHSDYAPPLPFATGGTLNETAITNVADPGFVDAAAGDFRLRHDSPFVDAGDPAWTAFGTGDRRGLPLLLDGDADGAARRDVGAYEYQRSAPKVTLAGPSAATVGTAVAFTGSATDVDGDALTYAWSFGDGATATGEAAEHTFAKAGTYVVTLTVTDAAGVTGVATATVTATGSAGTAKEEPVKVLPGAPHKPVDGEKPAVASETRPPAPGDEPRVLVSVADLRAPALSRLGVSRKRFAAARGTALRFALDEDAVVTVKVARVRSGRAAVAAGTLRLAARKGLTSRKIAKRIGKRALRPGTYRATVVAVDAAGNRSAARHVRFTVTRS